jgi:hypothetical protein
MDKRLNVARGARNTTCEALPRPTLHDPSKPSTLLLRRCAHGLRTDM